MPRLIDRDLKDGHAYYFPKKAIPVIMAVWFSPQELLLTFVDFLLNLMTSGLSQLNKVVPWPS